MAYKSTGRPVGRPKTKEYKTVLARIPADLEALVKRYASQHPGMSVAELIRDGLVWRIGDGDPRGMGMYLDESSGMHEKTYYINTETAPGVDHSAMLEDMRAALARQEAQIQALVHALDLQAIPDILNSYYGNTAQHAAAIRVEEQAAPTVLPAPTVQPTLHTYAGQETWLTPAAPTLKPDKATVDAYIHQLREQGLFYAQIADQLNADGIPTHSGRGTWAKGSVERVISGRKTASTSVI